MQKKLKIIINIITATILIGGLAFCIWNYFAHLTNCHGCSSHGAHPLIEAIFFIIFIMVAGAFFGISRLILFLIRNKIK